MFKIDKLFVLFYSFDCINFYNYKKNLNYQRQISLTTKPKNLRSCKIAKLNFFKCLFSLLLTSISIYL